jgi:KRAB domain-containing zinc finger protein
VSKENPCCRVAYPSIPLDGAGHKASKPLLRVKLDPARFACNAKGCQFAASTSITLRNHQRKMHSVRRFLCWPCWRNFRSDALLQAHVQHCHPLESPAPPPKPKPLYPHGRVRCPKPDCALLMLPGDKTHMCRKLLACDQCDKRFPTSTALKNHKMRHTGVYTLVCAKCNLGFAVYSDYHDHLEKHNQHHSYSCTECNYTSKTSVALRMHKKRQHRPEAAVLPVQIKIEEVDFE